MSGAQACLGCGKTFDCGMGSSEPCWCSSEFPAVMPVPQGMRGCYCRECLARIIAAGQQAMAPKGGAASS